MGSGGVPAIMGIKQEEDPWYVDAVEVALEVGLTVGGGVLGSFGGAWGAKLGAMLGQQVGSALTGEQNLPTEVAYAIGELGTADISGIKNPLTEPDKDTLFGKLVGALGGGTDEAERQAADALDVDGSEYANKVNSALASIVGGEVGPPSLADGVGPPSLVDNVGPPTMFSADSQAAQAAMKDMQSSVEENVEKLLQGPSTANMASMPLTNLQYDVGDLGGVLTNNVSGVPRGERPASSYGATPFINTPGIENLQNLLSIQGT
tara:strand:- start:650 stop:1438 length:789 start_codon:yes stop_codon:yes gene_type:complete